MAYDLTNDEVHVVIEIPIGYEVLYGLIGKKCPNLEHVQFDLFKQLSRGMVCSLVLAVLGLDAVDVSKSLALQ